MGKLDRALRRLAGVPADMETPPAASALDQIRERLAVTESELPALRAALDVALLDAELADPEQAAGVLNAREAARKAVQDAETRRSDLQRALAAAERQEAERTAKADADRIAAAWRQVDALAARRLDLGAEIDKRAAELMETVNEYGEVGAEIHRTAPVAVDRHSTGCTKYDPQQVAKAQLFRHGMAGVFAWPWNPADIPSGARTAEQHNAILRKYQTGEQ